MKFKAENRARGALRGLFFLFLVLNVSYFSSGCSSGASDVQDQIDQSALMNLLLFTNSQEETPTNSDCSLGYFGATKIGISTQSGTVNATQCTWYQFTAPSTSSYNFTLTYDDAVHDPDLRVYNSGSTPSTSSSNYSTSALITSPDALTGLNTFSGSSRLIRVAAFSCLTRCAYTLRVN